MYFDSSIGMHSSYVEEDDAREKFQNLKVSLNFRFYSCMLCMFMAEFNREEFSRFATKKNSLKCEYA